MLEKKTRVLLVLSQELLDQARVLAGKTTAELKLPVSLQIVLRALLAVGLRRENRAAFVASVESQARAVRRRRRFGGRPVDLGPMAHAPVAAQNRRREAR